MNIDRVYSLLKGEYKRYKTPVVELVEAQTKDPFKILVATLLSARTKDDTTSRVVKRLFKRIGGPHDLAKLPVKELEKLLFPIGFFRNKARFLKQLPEVLDQRFNGTVPDEIDDLVKLPGVGRKTANLVRAVAFKKPAICVDVHVHRIMNRLGYVKTETPYDTEMALRKKLPEKYWITINAFLVAFGQNHCYPRNPKCASCVIYKECKRAGVKTVHAKAGTKSR